MTAPSDRSAPQSSSGRRRSRRGRGGPGSKGAPRTGKDNAPSEDADPDDTEAAPEGTAAGSDEGQNAVPIEECEFATFELRPKLLQAIAECGYRIPSPIQSGAIPHALAGRDVIGQARTGTGKTAAFLVPALQLVSDKPGPRVLVVVPTRELAVQVSKEAQRLGKYMGVKAAAIYGGAPIAKQIKEVEDGAKVLAATPGRLLDHIQRRTIQLGELDMMVLDEADRMFDLGFRDDIAKIMKRAPQRRQTMLFSATLSDEVLALSAQYMNNPAEVFLAPDKMTVEEVDQMCIPVRPESKTELLLKVLETEQPEKSIIFTRTKAGADKLAARLKRRGRDAQEIHGDLPQRKREQILKDFREGKFPFLIATDVAARGLHIDDVSHVINYDIPQNPEDYVHRVGRTARMGKTGRAVTLCTAEDGQFLTAIEKLINQQIPATNYEGFAEDRAAKVEPKQPSYERTLQGYVRRKPRR